MLCRSATRLQRCLGIAVVLLAIALLLRGGNYTSMAGLVSTDEKLVTPEWTHMAEAEDIQELAVLKKSGEAENLDRRDPDTTQSLQGSEVLPSKFRLWIYVARGPDSEYMFLPVIATIVEAFRTLGIEAKIRYAAHHNVHLRQEMTVDLQQNHTTTIVVCVAWHKAPDAQTFISYLGHAGAYVILYNTEPSDLRWPRLVPLARNFSAKEVWDYSRAVLSLYEHIGTDVAKRYFPPGCADQLIVNVSQTSLSRDESNFGFLGLWFARSQGVRKAYNRTGRVCLPRYGKKGMYRHNIQSADGLRSWLEKYPVQLNLHSEWNHLLAFESLRAASLLPNGACLFADHTHPLDEDIWRDMVLFYNTSKSLLEAFEQMRNDHDSIQRCQSQAKKVFCSRMRPDEILVRSGFVAVLRELQAA